VWVYLLPNIQVDDADRSRRCGRGKPLGDRRRVFRATIGPRVRPSKPPSIDPQTLRSPGAVSFECATLARELPPPMFGTSKFLPTVNASGCNIKTPGHVPLDVEKYPVAPDNLALEQVHVYVRHGTCRALSSHHLALTSAP